MEVSGSDMHASEQEFGCIFAARHYFMSPSPHDRWQLARPAPVVSPSATVRLVLQDMQDCFSKAFIGTVDKNLTTALTSTTLFVGGDVLDHK